MMKAVDAIKPAENASGLFEATYNGHTIRLTSRKSLSGAATHAASQLFTTTVSDLYEYDRGKM